MGELQGSEHWHWVRLVEPSLVGYLGGDVDNLANKNTDDHPVTFEFQINNEYCFSISMSHEQFEV